MPVCQVRQTDSGAGAGLNPRRLPNHSAATWIPAQDTMAMTKCPARDLLQSRGSTPAGDLGKENRCSQPVGFQEVLERIGGFCSVSP